MAQPRCDHYEGAIINKFKSTTVHLRVVLQQYVEPVSFCLPEFDSFYVRLLFSRCLTCLLDLQDIQWAMENSRNTHKLARTPLANQKKKNHNSKQISSPSFTIDNSSESLVTYVMMSKIVI